MYFFVLLFSYRQWRIEELSYILPLTNITIKRMFEELKTVFLPRKST